MSDDVVAEFIVSSLRSGGGTVTLGYTNTEKKRKSVRDGLNWNGLRGAMTTYTTMKTAMYTEMKPPQVNQEIFSNLRTLARRKTARVATSMK